MDDVLIIYCKLLAISVKFINQTVRKSSEKLIAGYDFKLPKFMQYNFRQFKFTCVN